MSQTNLSIKCVSLVVAMVLALVALSVDAKLLRRSRYFDEGYESSPYAGGAHSTGERAILTVRGTRNPYDGSAPSKIAIEDQPARGAYPRGVYDRLDGYGGGGGYPMRGMYPSASMRYDPYGPSYNQGPYSGGYGNSYQGAPGRIAVTGAYPYGYGSRF